MNLLKRSLVFLTFFTCCICLGLLVAAMGTTHWFVASCRQRLVPLEDSVSQLQGNETFVRRAGEEEEGGGGGVFRQNSTGVVNFGLFRGRKSLNVGFGERVSEYEVTYPGGSEGLLSQGLWGGTIGCVAGGLLFTAIASVFAIINTVTTPVEAITGTTGLYIWNSVAALLELIAVILWSVQFSTNLSHNVLLVDYKQGWTTEGNETLGYSFWLVVVSIILHIVNCGAVAFGTYEPKAKEKIQEPDKATNDILLY